MSLLQKYLTKTEFADYADFKANCRINIPEQFDYARDVVDYWAAACPDKTALLYCNDEGEEKRFSFAEISLLSKKCAAYFKALGISKGDRMLLLLRRRYEYWIAVLALHRIGAVAVPASVQLTTKELAYRINAVNIKAICALNDEFVIEQLHFLPELCPCLEHIISVGGKYRNYADFDAEMPLYAPDDSYSELPNEAEMIIYATSATSGMPKMVSHNRLYPLGHIITAKFMQCVQDNGLHLTQADSGWAKFGWGNLYGQWLCGSAILAYDPLRFNAENMLKIMQKYRPTSLCIPPTMYRFLLKGGLRHEHIASVKWFATAGEPLSAEVNREFFELSGHYIHEGYGQSEGTPLCCSFPFMDCRPASMGMPSPLYELAIVDENMQPCPIGQKGEVIIFTHGRQPIGLLTHYYYEGRQICPYKDGIYHTGDIAYCDEQGFFWYVSRNDDMIKSSGYRIGPFEIESVLNTHPAVRESAIIGVPDATRGQLICAVIVLHEGYIGEESLTKELQNYVKRNTAPYKYPRIIKYIDAMPKTTSGKIIRRALVF